MGAERQPAAAGKDERRFPDRQIEIRAIPPAVTVSDDEAAPHLPFPRQEQPAADPELAGREIDEVENMPVGMGDPTVGKHRLRIDRQRLEITRLPEIVETVGLIRRFDCKKLVKLHAVGWIEGEGMCRRNAHPRLVS